MVQTRQMEIKRKRIYSNKRMVKLTIFGTLNLYDYCDDTNDPKLTSGEGTQF